MIKKTISVSLIALLGISSSALAASFKFSDFDFYRHNKPATSFHTTDYLVDGVHQGTGVNAFQEFVHTESSAIDLNELNARRLDATKLTLIKDIDDVKVYFINEGAGYKNQLKLKISGTQVDEGFIFYNGSKGNNQKTLRLGDYVNIGNLKGGAKLDFSLLANGYNNNGNFHTWYADETKNADGLQHVMAYQYQGYLILAWEDLYNGGDKDYNDIVFAIDLGEDNLNKIPTETTSNQAPSAIADHPETPYNTPILIDVLANDFDPDDDTISIKEVDDFLSIGGSAKISKGKILYTPDSGYSGMDSFTYTISDTSGVLDSATVSVKVKKRLAKATDDNFTTDENVVATYNVLDNDMADSDGSKLVVLEINGDSSLVAEEVILDSGAKVSIDANGNLSYDPNGAFDSLAIGEEAIDTFTYSIDDGDGGVSSASIQFTIKGVTNNNAPEANNDLVSMMGSVSKKVFVLENDFDVNGDLLEITHVNGTTIWDNDNLAKTINLPSGSQVTIGLQSGNNQDKYYLKYTPDPKYHNLTGEDNEVDTFTYTIDDGQGSQATATVTLNIGKTEYSD